MKYIGYAPHVCDYKDFIGFIPFTTDHSAASCLLSLCPQLAMGVLSLPPLVSRPGVRTFSDCPTESRITQILKSMSTS